MTTDRALGIVSSHSGLAVTSETPVEALGLDSLEMLDLFISLDIPDSAMNSVQTVGDIIDYVAG